MPCEYPPTRSFAAVAQLDDVEHLVDARRARAAVEVGEQAQVLAARQVGIEARALDEARDAVERPRAVDDRVAAEEACALPRSA